MRLLALFVTAGFSLCPAVASEPGQPLDCSDMVFLLPGHTCTQVPVVESRKGSNSVVDNEGRLLTVADSNGGGWLQVIADDLKTGSRTVVAEVNSRPGPNDTFDYIRTSKGCTSGPIGTFPCSNYESYVSDATWFDALGGSLYVPYTAFCHRVPTSGDCQYFSSSSVFQIDGFSRLFEIFETYTPTPSTWQFRSPAHPEGLPAADYFDTYYGELTNPIDFTQAQSLQCGYPASPPSVGDYLTVNDSLLDPAPGTGRYYVTAVTHQGQRRYGRQNISGVLSGRNPALLPACGR